VSAFFDLQAKKRLTLYSGGAGGGRRIFPNIFANVLFFLLLLMTFRRNFLKNTALGSALLGMGSALTNTAVTKAAGELRGGVSCSAETHRRRVAPDKNRHLRAVFRIRSGR
jgi:hypothetical protein